MAVDPTTPTIESNMPGPEAKQIPSADETLLSLAEPYAQKLLEALKEEHTNKALSGQQVGQIMSQYRKALNADDNHTANRATQALEESIKNIFHGAPDSQDRLRAIINGGLNIMGLNIQIAGPETPQKKAKREADSATRDLAFQNIIAELSEFMDKNETPALRNAIKNFGNILLDPDATDKEKVKELKNLYNEIYKIAQNNPKFQKLDSEEQKRFLDTYAEEKLTQFLINEEGMSPEKAKELAKAEIKRLNELEPEIKTHVINTYIINFQLVDNAKGLLSEHALHGNTNELTKALDALTIRRYAMLKHSPDGPKSYIGKMSMHDMNNQVILLEKARDLSQIRDTLNNPENPVLQIKDENGEMVYIFSDGNDGYQMAGVNYTDGLHPVNDPNMLATIHAKRLQEERIGSTQDAQNLLNAAQKLTQEQERQGAVSLADAEFESEHIKIPGLIPSEAASYYNENRDKIREIMDTYPKGIPQEELKALLIESVKIPASHANSVVQVIKSIKDYEAKVIEPETQAQPYIAPKAPNFDPDVAPTLPNNF